MELEGGAISKQKQYENVQQVHVRFLGFLVSTSLTLTDSLTLISTKRTKLMCKIKEDGHGLENWLDDSSETLN